MSPRPAPAPTSLAPGPRTLLPAPEELRVAARVRLRTRRFFCDTPSCPRQIFTERLPQTAAPHARQTARLDAMLRLLGAALGGAAGERLARAHGIAVSTSRWSPSTPAGCRRSRSATG
jgi:hypothetical protein